MNIKVYLNKPENSNPYYSNNLEIKSLLNIIKEIEKLDIKDYITMKDIIGGSRNTSAYECELDIELNEFSDEFAYTKKIIIEIVERYNGSYILKGGKPC